MPCSRLRFSISAAACFVLAGCSESADHASALTAADVQGIVDKAIAAERERTKPADQAAEVRARRFVLLRPDGTETGSISCTDEGVSLELKQGDNIALVSAGKSGGTISVKSGSASSATLVAGTSAAGLNATKAQHSVAVGCPQTDSTGMVVSEADKPRVFIGSLGEEPKVLLLEPNGGVIWRNP